MRKTKSFKPEFYNIALINSNKPVNSKPQSRARWKTVAAMFKPIVWSGLSTVTLVLLIA